MKITKKKLIELDACEDGLARFIEQTSNTEESVDVASLVGGLNTYSDLLWLAGETLTKERIVRFSFDCALISIKLIKPHADKREEIARFLREPRATAARAAYAACAAAPDATAAARAATDVVAIGSPDAVNALLIEMFNEVE